MTTILVQGEDPLAEAVACRLVDRVVAENASEIWLREQWTDQPANARAYISLKPSYQVRVPSKLRGNAKDAYRAFRAAQAHKERVGDAVALLLAFDADRRSEEHRIRAGVSAVKPDWPDIPTIIAEARPEFDAWVIIGHEPKDESERRALNDVVQAVGFDPRDRPHALNSTTDGERDAKQLCMRLLGLEVQADYEKHPRVRDALEAPLKSLAERGKDSGIPEFFRDISEQLLPFLGDR